MPLGNEIGRRRAWIWLRAPWLSLLLLLLLLGRRGALPLPPRAPPSVPASEGDRATRRPPFDPSALPKHNAKGQRRYCTCRKPATTGPGPSNLGVTGGERLPAGGRACRAGRAITPDPPQRREQACHLLCLWHTGKNVKAKCSRFFPVATEDRENFWYPGSAPCTSGISWPWRGRRTEIIPSPSLQGDFPCHLKPPMRA